MTVHNLKQLKRLNQVIFPVTYNDKFYKDVLDVGELAKLGRSHTHSRVLTRKISQRGGKTSSPCPLWGRNKMEI